MAELTRCRSTVNLVGARAGAEVLCDLTKPAIVELVDAGYLVPLNGKVKHGYEHLADAAVGSQEASGADTAADATQDTPEP